MTELIGDVCEPSDFSIPKHESQVTTSTVSEGFLFLSGLKIWFHDGVDMKVVTSS